MDEPPACRERGAVPSSYHRSDYSVPSEIRRQVETCIPNLFLSPSVLYVGANRFRQHFLDDFLKNGAHVELLEISSSNVAYLCEKYWRRNVSITRGDVRTCRKFDVDTVFFYHGPEHIARREMYGVLERLESMCRLIVCGMPYGNYPQGPVYGNGAETHLQAIYPEDMEHYGYEVNTIGEADDSLSNMIAWKVTKYSSLHTRSPVGVGE